MCSPCQSFLHPHGAIAGGGGGGGVKTSQAEHVTTLIVLLCSNTKEKEKIQFLQLLKKCYRL